MTMPASAPPTRLVYSTEAGRVCPDCGQPVLQCACKRRSEVSLSADGIVRVSRETKGRAGKGVTLVQGLGLEGDALTALAKALKATCGSGGTVKDGVVEVQGDHCDKVLAYLAAKGWKAKRAGG
jgi:translation initiation factor 1